MLPTSARVAQEVYEPLIGIQYPMLCSRLGDTWQIGAASIREDQLIASGLRFVQWRHASPNVDARKDPKNNPMVRVYQHLEDELTRAGAGNEGILALTTTREGAQNLRNYFDIARKKANAETAVKVAGATAKHCIVIHGESTFLSGEGRNLDYDQECFTRANVAYSRATNLTILAWSLNTQGMPGALQVLAALLHGVQSIDTYDDWAPVIRGSLDLTARGSKEGPLAQPFTLITLAGEKLPIAVDPNAHVCLRGFENAVLAELPYLGCNSTLGCELQFAQTDTHQVQQTPYRVN